MKLFCSRLPVGDKMRGGQPESRLGVGAHSVCMSTIPLVIQRKAVRPSL